MNARTDEALQACLDDLERGGLSVEECLRRQAGSSEPVAALLRTAERYRQAPSVRPSSAFRAAARARMLNLTATTSRQARFATVATLRNLFWPWRWRVITSGLARVAIVLLLVAALGGGVAVAASAEPESPLYPARLAIERARLTLAGSEAERAQLHLAFAERRAEELATLARTAGSPVGVASAAHRYETALRDLAGPDTGPTMWPEVETGLERQQRLLEETRVRLGDGQPEARASLGEALGELERTRAALRRRLGGASPAPTSTPRGAPEPLRQRELAPIATPKPLPTEMPGPSPSERQRGQPSGKQGHELRPQAGQPAPTTGTTATPASGFGPLPATPTRCDPTPASMPSAGQLATATPSQTSQGNQWPQATVAPQPMDETAPGTPMPDAGSLSGPQGPNPTQPPGPATSSPSSDPAPALGGGPGPGGWGGSGPVSPGSGGRR